MALTAKKVYAILKRQISDMEAKLNSPVRYRGTVATADLLPLNPDIGDMYNIESKSVYGEAGMNVAWNGVVWDTMGAPIDMSLYIKSSELADWVKQQNKPTYTADEVGALPDTTVIPSKTSELQNDSGFLTKIPDNYLSGTDKTLNVSGKAADAKATGDKITELSANISNKLNKNQGSENSGKIAGINESGDIVPMFPVSVDYNEETNCLEFGSDQKMELNKGINLDSTLTKTGYAADAGAVGEITNSLKEDLTQIHRDNLSDKVVNVTRNIYTDNNRSEKTFLLSNGGTNQNNDYYTTDFIPIEAVEHVFSGKSDDGTEVKIQRICFYDSEKNFVSVLGTNKEIIVPQTAYYMRASIHYGIYDVQIEKGNIVTQYTPNKSLILYSEDVKGVECLYPEMFGAIGDGVTDDTNAIKLMIQYSVENSKSVRFINRKTYGITSPIVLENKFFIDLAGATIKAISDVDYVFYINKPEPSKDLPTHNTEAYSFLMNGFVDCNQRANNGVYINAGSRDTYQNLVITGSKNSAFTHDDTYETTITNIYMYNCKVGIHSLGTDAIIYNINMRNVKTAIIVSETGMGNIYNTIHAWNEDIIVGTVFAECYKEATFINCYVDSYQYGYKVNNEVYIKISDGVYYLETEYWNAFNPPESSVSYFIYADAEYKIRRVYCEGVRLVGMTNGKSYFQPFPVTEVHMPNVLNNIMQRVVNNYPYGDYYYPSITEQSAVPKRYTKPYVLKRDILCELRMCFEFPSMTYATPYTLCTLPKRYAPINDLVFNAECGIASSGTTYAMFGSAKLTVNILSNGDVNIRASEAINEPIYVNINQMYYTNYEY